MDKMRSQEALKEANNWSVKQFPLPQFSSSKTNIGAFNSNRKYNNISRNPLEKHNLNTNKTKNLDLWKLRNPALRRLTPLPAKKFDFFNGTIENPKTYTDSLPDDYGDISEYTKKQKITEPLKRGNLIKTNIGSAITDLKEMCIKNDEEISSLKGELTKFNEVEYELNNLRVEYQKLKVDNGALMMKLEEQTNELTNLTKENDDLKLSNDNGTNMNLVNEQSTLRNNSTAKDNGELGRVNDTIKYLTEENEKLKMKLNENNIETLRQQEKIKLFAEENEKLMENYKAQHEMNNAMFANQPNYVPVDDTAEIWKYKELIRSLTNEISSLKEKRNENEGGVNKLEKYKEKIKSLTEKNEKLKRKVEKKEEEIQETTKHYESKIKRLTEENIILNESEKNKTAQLRRHKDEIEDLNQANEKLKKKKKNYRRRHSDDDNRYYDNTGRLRELLEENERLKSKSKKYDEELGESLKSYKSTINALTEENERIKAKIIKDEFENNENIKKYKDCIRNTTEEIEVLKQQLKRKEDESKDNVQSLIEEIANLKGKAKKDETESNTTIGKLNEKINTLTEEIDNLNKKNKEANSINEELEKNIKRIKELNDENSKLSKDMEELKKSIIEVKSKEVANNNERMKQQAEEKTIQEQLRKNCQSLTAKIKTMESKRIFTCSNNVVSIAIPKKKLESRVIDEAAGKLLQSKRSAILRSCVFNEGVLNISVLYGKKRYDYLMQSGILDLVIKILKNSTEDYSRTEIICYLYTITYQSPEVVQELISRELPIIFTEQAIKETKGVQVISDFIIVILSGIKCIIENSELISSEFTKKSFIKSLLLCLNFGKRLVRVSTMTCICLLYQKMGKVDYEDDLWSLLTILWERAEDANDRTLAVLCLAVLSYYGDTQKHRDALQGLKLIVPRLLKHIKDDSLDVDTDFFEICCRTRMIYLVKYLSITPDQQQLFINEGVIKILEVTRVSDYQQVRDASIELLGLYRSRFSNVKFDNQVMQSKVGQPSSKKILSSPLSSQQSALYNEQSGLLLADNKRNVPKSTESQMLNKPETYQQRNDSLNKVGNSASNSMITNGYVQNPIAVPINTLDPSMINNTSHVSNPVMNHGSVSAYASGPLPGSESTYVNASNPTMIPGSIPVNVSDPIEADSENNPKLINQSENFIEQSNDMQDNVEESKMDQRVEQVTEPIAGQTAEYVDEQMAKPVDESVNKPMLESEVDKVQEQIAEMTSNKTGEFGSNNHKDNQENKNEEREDTQKPIMNMPEEKLVESYKEELSKKNTEEKVFTEDAELSSERMSLDKIEPKEMSEEVMVKLITSLDNNDEKVDLKSVKHLLGMARNQDSCLPMVDNNALAKTLKLLSGSNANLALLAADLISRLLQLEKGQKQFLECDGLELIFPFIKSQDRKLKDIWYKLLSKSLAYPDSQDRLGNINDASSLLKQGLAECGPKNYKFLIGILRYIPSELLGNILDKEMCARILAIILQIEGMMDKEGHIGALTAIGGMCDTAEGKDCIEKNKAIIDYVKKAFGNNELADQAAEVYYSFLVNELNEDILKMFLPSLVLYSRKTGATAKQNYKDILEQLSEYEILHKEYTKMKPR